MNEDITFIREVLQDLSWRCILIKDTIELSLEKGNVENRVRINIGNNTYIMEARVMNIVGRKHMVLFYKNEIVKSRLIDENNRKLRLIYHYYKNDLGMAYFLESLYVLNER